MITITQITNEHDQYCLAHRRSDETINPTKYFEVRYGTHSHMVSVLRLCDVCLTNFLFAGVNALNASEQVNE